jgi:hypothetical protein
MNSHRTKLLMFVFLALHPIAAQAYIGPGVGAGAIAAVLGVIASIFLALFAVIYYPVKRMIKRRAPPPDTSFKDPKA